MQVSDKNIQDAIKQNPSLNGFKINVSDNDLSLYSFESPKILFNQMKENIPSFEKTLDSLPTIKITYGYDRKSLLEKVLKFECIERINLFVKKAIELDELTSFDLAHVQKTIFCLSKNFDENQKKIYQILKQNLGTFSKSPPYIYDRSMNIFDLDNNINKVSRCARSVKNFRTKPSLEDLRKMEEGEEVLAPKKKKFECRHYIENILAFVKRYKKIHLPAALMFFIQKFPLLFIEKILPDLSQEELKTLMNFSKMEEINKRIFSRANNYFNLNLFLIKNGCFAFIEENLKIEENPKLELPSFCHWNNYKKNFLKLENIKKQMEEEWSQKSDERYVCEILDDFSYSSNVSSDLKNQARKNFLKMLNALFKLNAILPRKRLGHYHCFKLVEGGEEFKYQSEINVSNKIFNSHTQVEGFKLGAYLKSFENNTIVTLNEKPISSYIYKYNPTFYLSSDWTSKILSGRDTERISFSAIHEPNVFWDNWENKLISSYQIYKNVIYPTLINVVLKILESKPASGSTLLEICGGKGHLANKILEDRPNTSYTLFEYNDPSIFAARQILGNRANVIKKDIVEDPFEIENESVDIVLGSGAFTYEVLRDKEAGIKVIKKILLCLKKDGFLVLSGLAPSILTAKEFKKYGFKVLNKSSSDEKSFKSIQLYILKKITHQRKKEQAIL